jgi:hypothetical protein
MLSLPGHPRITWCAGGGNTGHVCLSMDGCYTDSERTFPLEEGPFTQFNYLKAHANAIANWAPT